MHNWILQMLSITALLCSLGQSAYAATPLRIATEDDYFPFSYRLPDGTHVGYDVDIGRALCARLERDCCIIPMPFNDLIPAAQAGKIDLIVAGLARSAEREKKIVYVVPYYRSRTVVVGKADEHIGVVSAETMRGKRIAAQAGTVQLAHVQTLYGDIATIIPTATVEASFLLLQNGGADILFADSLVCMALLIKNEVLDLDYVAEPLSVVDESSQAYIVAPLGNDAFVQQVQNAFSRLRTSDEFYTINQKYFPFSIY